MKKNSISQKIKSAARRRRKYSEISKKFREHSINYLRAQEATSGEEYCCTKQELLALEVTYLIYGELEWTYFRRAFLKSKYDFVLLIMEEEFELPESNPDGTPYSLEKKIEEILKENHFTILSALHLEGKKEYHICEDVLY